MGEGEAGRGYSRKEWVAASSVNSQDVGSRTATRKMVFDPRRSRQSAEGDVEGLRAIKIGVAALGVAVRMSEQWFGEMWRRRE